MSSTRHAANNSPLAFERHLSSPIYADRRPIPANIVAEKAVGYRSPSDRRLLFFLQALSVEQGGLTAAADDLAAAFPEMSFVVLANRETQTMLNMRAVLGLESDDIDHVKVLHDGLISLCINPGLDLDELKEEPSGRSVLQAIEKFRLQRVEREKASIAKTSLGAEVIDTLDQSASLGGITIFEAPAGSGKSESTKGWCRAHLGECYFITLSGITTRTGLMQAIATALGLATCQRKASELQNKIETFFRRTGAHLIIDEAHFLWPQSKRITSNPELIDWIDTLVNMGARIALICTDQFARQKDRVEKQTAWTSDQFRHRVREHRVVGGRATLADLKAVASFLLSFAHDADSDTWTRKLDGKPDADVVEMVVHSANKSTLPPLAHIRSLVERAQFFAHVRNGRDCVSLRDFIAALEGQDRTELSLNIVPGAADRAGRRSPMIAEQASVEVTPPAPLAEQMSRISTVLPAASSRRRRRSPDMASA